MEELRVFIESEDVVTARWLAHKLSIKINQAYDLLKKYKASHHGGQLVKAFYLLTGHRKTGDYIIMVVPETAIEQRKLDLNSVLSCEIYSLQRDSRTTALPGMRSGSVLQLYYADSNQEYTMLCGGQHSGDAMLTNSAGRIKLSGASITLKPAGERVNYSGYAAPRALTSVAVQPAKVGNGSGASAAIVEEAMKSSKKSTTNAPNFFGSSVDSSSGKLKAQHSSTNSSSASSVKPGQISSFQSSNNTNNFDSKQVQNMNADEEWDDGTGEYEGYKPNKDNLKKRKVALGMPDGSGGMHQADVEQQYIEDGSEEPSTRGDVQQSRSPGPSPSKSSIHVRGAIDDWREDGTPAGPPKKRTKIKTVEKMLMDDRGYMITTMVEEEVTDDEEPSIANQKMQQKVQKSLPVPSSSAAKPKSTKAAPAGQTGMMSFFGKK